MATSKTNFGHFLSHWMPAHCARAKRKLQLMLGLDQFGIIPSSCDSRALDCTFRARVETAAGVMVAQFSFDESTTVMQVKAKVAQIAPQFPACFQQFLFSGHENYDLLKDEDRLKQAIEKIISSSSQPTGGAKLNQATAGSDAGSRNEKVKNQNAVSSDTTSTSTNKSKSCNSAAKLQQGSEICLCLTVRTPRWSRSRSHCDLELSNNDRRIKQRGLLSLWPGAVGAFRLTHPGHFFTIQIREVPKYATHLLIGVASERVLSMRQGVGMKGDVFSTPATSHRVGVQLEVRMSNNLTSIRSVGRNKASDPYREVVGIWEPGDTVTLRLESSDQTSRRLMFAINDKLIKRVVIARDNASDEGAAFVPYCSLPAESVVEMVAGDGEPLPPLTE